MSVENQIASGKGKVVFMSPSPLAAGQNGGMALQQAEGHVSVFPSWVCVEQLEGTNKVFLPAQMIISIQLEKAQTDGE